MLAGSAVVGTCPDLAAPPESFQEGCFGQFLGVLAGGFLKMLSAAAFGQPPRTVLHNRAFHGRSIQRQVIRHLCEKLVLPAAFVLQDFLPEPLGRRFKDEFHRGGKSQPSLVMPTRWRSPRAARRQEWRLRR